MIVVFVVDTSPSMDRPVVTSSPARIEEAGMTSGRSLTRLDLAKMAVEDLSRRLRKGLAMNLSFPNDPGMARSLANLGQAGPFVPREDALLLLTTSRQYPDTASCAAGGRLLVGFGTDDLPIEDSDQQQQQQQFTQQYDPLHYHHLESFQKQLKGLQAAKWDPKDGDSFPEDAGGAAGLNAALSAGLQLLSRYRLHSRFIENFGQGRLPCASMQIASDNPKYPPASALQPACLILVTDGACLRQPPEMGGGDLQLQYGSQPLREFYKEPFRWDQRIFCLAVGDALESKQYLHPHLRTLVEVTGGAHWMVRQPSALPTEAVLRRIRPPLPKDLPLNDPLFARMPAISYITNQLNSPTPTLKLPPGASFVNAGPICCFQAYEGDAGGVSVPRRAMLLYTASLATSISAQVSQSGNEVRTILSQPLWCIPESYFPSKKLDTLPPRSAQPLLLYSKYPANLGSKSFEPLQVIRMLHKLDQLTMANKKALHQQVKCLHRDVYICEWLSAEPDESSHASAGSQAEYFPVFCQGAGRPTLSESAETFINIGILHIPSKTNIVQGRRYVTLTFLPPEPHILLPLLLRAAEAEQRAIKKAEGKHVTGGNSIKINVLLDDHWRSEFQAYLFRLPPYYQHSLKRCLRPVLPSCAHSILNSETSESMALQCFSKVCLQKIRNGEQIAKDTNERLEKQEAGLRRLSTQLTPIANMASRQQFSSIIKYGNYDPRMRVDTYLEVLRSLPPPWRVQNSRNDDTTRKVARKSSADSTDKEEGNHSALEVLGDMPASCLAAYYESRRRWIFGGPSLTMRGLHVEGVDNGGGNIQRCGRRSSERDESLLSIAGVGISILNETSTARMGDYKERLVFSRSPIVGYGANDATGVAATTAADGSPVWSVDDTAMPPTFFDSKTGEFVDSVQARSLSKIVVNFGNPFREKRADSIIPLKYLPQAPSAMRREISDNGVGSPRTPPGSPPNSSFESVEEGEAIFVARSSPSRSSHTENDSNFIEEPATKRQRTGSVDESGANATEVLAVLSSESKNPASAVSGLKTTPRPSGPGKPSAPPAQPSKLAQQGAQSAVVASSSKKPPAPPKAPIKGGPVIPPRPPPPPKQPQGSKPPPPPPPGQGASLQKEKSSGSVINPPHSRAPAAPTITTASSEFIASQAPGQNTPANILHYENPDEKPQVQLPAGWICVWSKSQKRWYFFDTKTNTSVWKWPPDVKET